MPNQNEKMRLVPADTLTGAELKPIYQKLLRFARDNPKRVSHSEMQGILWGIREIANGHNTQSRFLSEQQLQIMNEAAPEAATILQRLQFEGKIKGIVFEKADKWLKEATKNLPIPLPSIERLTNGGSPEEIVRETTGTVANNQLGRFFNQIPDATARMTVEQTLAGLTGLPIGGVQGFNGEYTLLSPNVAAKTHASGHLGARIEIVNHSAGIFPFEAESCVAQSQRSAQRIALQPLAYTVQVNHKDYKKVQGVFQVATLPAYPPVVWGDIVAAAAAGIEAAVAVCLANPIACAAAGVMVGGCLIPSDTDNDDRCYKRYQADIETCAAIGKRSKQRAKVCYKSASERLAACISGKPTPPLNTWNN